MSIKATTSFSSVITALRFPLILLVVAIHLLGSTATHPNTATGGGVFIYLYISELLSHNLANIAVPMFFFISGYYAFYKKDWRQEAVWSVGLKKRAKTLLLPYILWNSLYLLLLLSKTQLETLLNLDTKDPFYINSLSQLLHYYWDDVIVYPLWYMRDLIVLCLFAPILYRILSWSKGYILLPLLVAFILCWDLGITGLNTLAFFCFMLGGWLGIKQIDPLEKLQRVKYLVAVIALGLVFSLPLLPPSSIVPILGRIYILTGSASALLLTQYIAERRPAITLRLGQWSKYVFFIYAVHTVLLVNWARGIVFRVPFLREDADGALLGYFLIGVLTLAFSLTTYAIIKRIAPRTLAILSGGR